MAGILLPGDWKQQPAQQRRLKPEFDRPAFLAVPGQLRPVVQSAQTMTYPVDVTAGLFSGNSGSTTRGLSLNGPGVVTTSGTGYQFQRVGSATDAYIETPSGADFTWVFQVDRIGYTGANPGFFRNSGGGGNTFVLIPSSGLWVRQNGSDFTSSIAAPAAGSSVTVVVSVRSGISVKAWINGVQVLNSTTATTTGDSTNVSGVNFLGRHSATEYLTGNHTLAGHWHRAFADSANRALSLNPWALFAPLPRRMLVSVAAATGKSQSIAFTLDTVTAAASETAQHPQSILATLATIAAAATQTAQHPQSAAATLADISAAASQVATHPQTFAATLADVSAAITQTNTGAGKSQSLAVTLADVTVAATQTARHGQSIAASLAGVTVAGAQTAQHAESLAAVLADVSVAAAQTNSGAGKSQSLAVTLDGVTVAASQTARHGQTAAAVLDGIDFGLSAGLQHPQSLAAVLAGLSVSVAQTNIGPAIETDPSIARTVYVSPEGRRYYVAPEGRTVYVAPEGRRVYVEPQGRTIEI